eukprot:52991_1
MNSVYKGKLIAGIATKTMINAASKRSWTTTISDCNSPGTPCTRLPFSAFLASLLVIGVIHYTTAVFCERPLSPTRCANRSIGTTDSGALEGMPETEGEAQLSIQRSAIDKNGRVLMHKIVNRKGDILSWQRVLMLLQGGGQESLELADALTAAVGNSCPFKAVFWEAIPLSRARIHDIPFAFVLADAPLLETMEADSHAFDEHKPTDGALVSTFNNLGGDALLISPVKLRQEDSDAEYTHIKVFMSRNGEMEKLQARQMWKTLGEGLKRLLDDSSIGQDHPLWAS